MKSALLNAASLVVPKTQILVNMISRRVRQLSQGHRPLVEFVPGMGLADIALTEVIQGKLTYESTFGLDKTETAPAPKVVTFPAGAGKKAA